MLTKIIKLLKSHVVASFVIYGFAIGLLLGALWFAYQFVDPAPPTKVVIAAGGTNGAYFEYANEYAKLFAEQGVELKVLETAGSMDNLSRMSDDSDVDAAFMQGGITTPQAHPHLQSLGSLYYEPIWVFYNADLKIDNLLDLEGLKIAIGPKGSGTNFVISSLLAENDITRENTTILDAGYTEAIKQKADVIFLITGVKAQVIKDMSAPGSKRRLLSFARAEAYARSHHYLAKLMLPQGAINLADNLPQHDMTLVAPTANLVIKEALHPAIKYLFLLAANKVHGKGDIFSMPGEFPNNKALLFPLADEADSFFKKGPPLLLRYLPFQLAITLERLKILLIPLLTLLYPLFKVTPPAYRWQIRRRIFKWYKQLKQLDTQAYEIVRREDANDMLHQLEILDRQVLETSVPLSYTDYIYSLRIHIRMIQDRLEKISYNDESNNPEG